MTSPLARAGRNRPVPARVLRKPAAAKQILQRLNRLIAPPFRGQADSKKQARLTETRVGLEHHLCFLNGLGPQQASVPRHPSVTEYRMPNSTVRRYNLLAAREPG